MSEDNPFEGLAEKLRGEAFTEAMERVRLLREGEGPSPERSSAVAPAPSLAPRLLLRRSVLGHRDAPEAWLHALQILTLSYSWGAP